MNEEKQKDLLRAAVKYERFNFEVGESSAALMERAKMTDVVETDDDVCD